MKIFSKLTAIMNDIREYLFLKSMRSSFKH
jgi:hypothetical protein